MVPDQLDAVRSIHVTAGTGTSISTDGTTAMLEFTMPDGGRVGLTLPIAGLAGLRTMCNDLVAAARKRDVGAGNVAPRFPNSFSVGHSDQIRGAVMMMFDQDTPQELVVAMRDQPAADFADAIRTDIAGRSGGALRRPANGRIIIPGRS